MSDREIARLLRQPESRVKIRRPIRQRAEVTLWTEAEDKLLGKWPDERVAQYLGRKFRAVQTRRQKLRILRQTHRSWTPEEIRLIDPAATKGPLGEWTSHLAKVLGRSIVSVKTKRLLYYGPRHPKRAWTPREIALLGTRTDREIAIRLGREKACVTVRRRILRIPSYRSRQSPLWTPAQDKLLGTACDRAVAEKLGYDYYYVKKRRQTLGIPQIGIRLWTRKEEKLVGVLDDKEVARRTGRTVKSVLHRRRALKLPPANPIMHYWTAEEDQVLLALPYNNEVARLLSRSMGQVRQRRSKLKRKAARNAASYS